MRPLCLPIAHASTARTLLFCRGSFALHSQYTHTWESFGWVVGGGAVLVAVVIAVLQGSLVISLLMVLSIVMVVLQVTID